MSWDDIRAAIETYLDTNWTATAIAWDNVNFAGGRSPWIRATIFEAGAARETLTGNSATGFRSRGALMVNVFTPANTGSGAAYQAVDDLIGLFREKTLTTDSGRVQFLSDETLRREQDSAWFQLDWTIQFEHDNF